ncbi:MAG: hypothetical protein OXU96_01530 [Gammaproteobacteria bacterium]|nr:hypothetical protein [Gammaproteobacteria bacterium]
MINPNTATDTPVDEYLRRFGDCRRVTLIGPTLAHAPRAGRLQEPLIWVDGGADHRRGQTPAGVAVGDGDSAHGKLDQYLNADKDYSDLAFVLRRLPAHFAEVVLLGFLGARRDHELFNLGEVHHFLAAAGAPTRARFDRNIYAYSKGEWRFQSHSVFSLAAIEPATVTLTGACKYRLTAPTRVAPLASFGLSNRGAGRIILRTDGPVFIFKSQYNTGSAARR